MLILNSGGCLLMEKQSKNYIFPFLWMHGEDETVLREYVNVIYNSNIRAFCVESRPHPDFCKDGWWHDMDIILDEAKNLVCKYGYWMIVIFRQGMRMAH